STPVEVVARDLLRQSYRSGVDVDPLHRQAIVQGAFGTLLFMVLIFWPAGTFDYWRGWLFLGVFAASTVGFTVYMALYDRPLLERRMKAGPQHEPEWSQKIIVSLVYLAFFASIVLPGLDYRYAWSPVGAVGVDSWRRGDPAVLPVHLLGDQGQQLRRVQHSRGAGSDR